MSYLAPPPLLTDGFSQTPGGTGDRLIRHVREEVAKRLSNQHAERDTAGAPRLEPADERQLARELINEQLRREAKNALADGRPPASEAHDTQVVKAVMDLLFGLGPLSPYLERPDVVNIHVVAGEPVWLELLDGTWIREAPVARSGDELVELVRELGRRVGVSERRFDQDAYRVNLQLPDGSRLFAIGWVARQPHVFIRRHHLLDVSLDDLVVRGSISPLVRAFLGAAVRSYQNVLVAGGQGDGKTTLLRAMASDFPVDEPITTVETDFELSLDRLPQRHSQVTALEARQPNVEGKGGVTSAQLVRDSMRTAAVRIVVGEVLSEEIVPMLNAMNSGNKGSMCSLHANGTEEVFGKLVSIAAQAPERLDELAVNRLAAAAVDFTVFVRRDRSRGRGVVSSIREVSGFDGQRPLTNELFAPGRDLHAVPTGVPIGERHRQAFLEVGFDPRGLFEAP
jgi:pilus assembly protein CpaF